MGDGITQRHIGRLAGAAVFSALIAGSAGVHAGDGTATQPLATVAAQGSGPVLRPNVNCTCRFRGEDFSIGESVCIRGSLATCSTFLNNTSWAISKTPCPVASLDAAGLPTDTISTR